MALTPHNAGRPDTDAYLLGRGQLRLDIFTAAGERSNLLLDIGNVNEFNITLEEETIDHQSSRSGLKQVDTTITLSKSAKGSFQVDEITSQILELFTSADSSESALSDIVDGNVYIPRNAGGYWIELWDGAAGSGDAAAGGERVIGDSGATLTVDGFTASTDFVTNDYVADAERGMIYVVPGGALDLGTNNWRTFDLTYSGTPTAERNKMLQKTVVRAALVFSGANAQTGEKYDVRLHKVKLQADGDFAAIGSDFANLTFAFTAEADTSFDADSPVGTITKLRD